MNRGNIETSSKMRRKLCKSNISYYLLAECTFGKYKKKLLALGLMLLTKHVGWIGFLPTKIGEFL